MKWIGFLALAIGAVLPGSSFTADAHVDPARPHHRDGGFQNNHVGFEPKGMLTLLQWQWDAWRNGLPRPPRAPTPRVDPDLAFVHANAMAGAAMVPAITWIGHATMLAQFGGLNLLTDPVFSERRCRSPALRVRSRRGWHCPICPTSTSCWSRTTTTTTSTRPACAR